MSKDLVDADVYTPAIHVPEGIDSRDHAAEDVELLAQGLANRTHNLNVHAAKKDVANTFTKNQVISSGGTLTVAGLVTAQGGLTVVGNAAVPNISGNVAIAGAAAVGGAAMGPAGSLTTQGEVTSKSHVSAEANVYAQGEYYYYGSEQQNGPSRTVFIDILGAGNPEGDGTAVFGTISLGQSKTRTFPVRVPSGCVMGACRIKIKTGASPNYTIQLWRRFPLSMSSPAVVSPLTDIVHGVTGVSTPAGDGVVVSLNWAEKGQLVSSRTEQYWVLITNSAASQLHVYGIDLTFKDPGPRNF